MEVLLQNTLPLKGSQEGLVWVYSEKPVIWSKYTQYVQGAIEVPVEVPIHVPIHVPVEVPIHVPKHVPIRVPVEVPIHVPVEVPIHVPVEVAIHVPIEVPVEVAKKPDKKGAKTQKILPMELIIQLSQNNIMNTEHIQQQLHTFISQKEFSKAFGVKKCSEIMSGITNNKWNKSLVLFLSFLFDTKFIYLNKEVVFDNDKCNSVIHI
jgi:hypothetical protein